MLPSLSKWRPTPWSRPNELAGRSIARGESAALSERYLQRLEVRWCHVNQVGYILGADLRTVSNSEVVVERTLIRNGEANRDRLHSGNVLHGRGALVQQLQKGGPIVVASIVQRSFCNDNIFRVESGRQCLQIYEGPYQQSCDCEENDGQGYFTEDQGVTGAGSS